MTIWDDRILEYLQSHESATPTKLAESGYFEVSRPHIGRRCKALAEHGLLNHLGNAVYVITEKGEGYLKGKYDAENEVWMTDEEGPSASASGSEEANGA